MRVPSVQRILPLLLFSLLGFGWNSAIAQDAAPSSEPVSGVTLAIFPDSRRAAISDHRWQAIESAIGVQLNSPEARMLGAAQILRGDRITPGQTVSNPIVVYLHGDCQTVPPTHFAGDSVNGSALGWVIAVHGKIDPFIHVDCRRIGQMLWTRGNFLSPEERDQIMANAVARVILHEWIHIAKQSTGHSTRGLAKAHFGIDDLAPYPSAATGRGD